MPGHTLWQGSVSRTLYTDRTPYFGGTNYISIQNDGIGNGSNPLVNEYLAGPVWADNAAKISNCVKGG
jgi:hypothetical protein